MKRRRKEAFIRLRGSAANQFLAALLVDKEGERAREGTTGEMLDAIERELARKKTETTAGAPPINREKP